MDFDFLLVGAGLFNGILANELKKYFRILVVEKRNHIGGNCYSKKEEGIDVHVYGPHIFHTNNKEVFDYINKLVEFNNFINCPLAYYKGKLYNLPFNMNLFYQVFKVKDPYKVKEIIDRERQEIKVIRNFEDQAISMVGKTIYLMFIKEYTEKQWGRKATELPSFIIKRLPLRFYFNNNYYDDLYQGIPKDGYTKIFEKLFKGVKVLLNTNYFQIKNKIKAKYIVYTGMIDEFFNYRYGQLEYRSLKFKNKIINKEIFQGNAIINYPEKKYKFTRIIEHKFFNYKPNIDKTIITYEYPIEYKKGLIPYYPISLEKNSKIYNKYLTEAKKIKNVFFKGRLGEYKYYDMDDIIENALKFSKFLLKNIKN
jgi:UDP-galactopyranose mutase